MNFFLVKTANPRSGILCNFTYRTKYCRSFSLYNCRSFSLYKKMIVILPYLIPLKILRCFCHIMVNWKIYEFLSTLPMNWKCISRKDLLKLFSIIVILRCIFNFLEYTVISMHYFILVWLLLSKNSIKNDEDLI